jgi:hypothetical protein
MSAAQEYGFGDVSHMLGLRMRSLVDALGLKGATQGDLFMPLNPTRGDRHPGSFVITVGGSRAGRWDEYATGDYGDALDLVVYINFGRTDDREAKRQAFRWAKRWLGLSDEPERMANGTAKLEMARRAAEEMQAKAAGEIAGMVAKKRRGAMRMWLEAKKLAAPGPNEKSSPAWAYFNECRGFPMDKLARLPSAVKWTLAAKHVETDRLVPAIVSAMFLPDSTLAAVHRIFLEPDGLAKIDVPRGVPQKKIWPAGYLGAFVPLSRGRSGVPVAQAVANGEVDEIYYCEGVEDGFAAAILVPEWRVYAVGAARNFAFQDPPPCAGAVIVGRDNDPDKKVRAQVGRHIQALRETCAPRGLTVYETRAQGAKDFAEMLSKGSAA